MSTVIAREAMAEDSVTILRAAQHGHRVLAAASTATDGHQLGSTVRQTNNRSVVGLRGVEHLGGLAPGRVADREQRLAGHRQGQIAGRNTRVGLQGDYGLLFMGHWQTPYTESTAGYDPYYPTTAGYMALIGNGSTSSSDNVQDNSNT